MQHNTVKPCGNCSQSHNPVIVQCSNKSTMTKMTAYFSRTPK